MGVGSVFWFLATLLLELAFATPKLRAWFQFRNVDAPHEGATPFDFGEIWDIFQVKKKCSSPKKCQDFVPQESKMVNWTMGLDVFFGHANF